MLVGIECDKCADEGIEDCFTLDLEHFLDGSRVWYCSYGHYDYKENLVLYPLLWKWDRKIYVPMKKIQAQGREPYSLTPYHDHSGYGKHPITRKHRLTKKKDRRFRNLEEFWYNSRRVFLTPGIKSCSLTGSPFA